MLSFPFAPPSSAPPLPSQVAMPSGAPRWPCLRAPDGLAFGRRVPALIATLTGRGGNQSRNEPDFDMCSGLCNCTCYCSCDCCCYCKYGMSTSEKTPNQKRDAEALANFENPSFENLNVQSFKFQTSNFEHLDSSEKMSVLQAQSEMKAQACKSDVLESLDSLPLSFQDPSICYIGNKLDINATSGLQTFVSEKCWDIDDEMLACMEAREDAERGNDVWNSETFGCCVDFCPDYEKEDWCSEFKNQFEPDSGELDCDFNVCSVCENCACFCLCEIFLSMEFVVKSGILTLAPLTLVPLLALVSAVVLTLVLVLGLLILRPSLGLLLLP